MWYLRYCEFLTDANQLKLKLKMLISWGQAWWHMPAITAM
jgi:hypothetical protein